MDPDSNLYKRLMNRGTNHSAADGYAYMYESDDDDVLLVPDTPSPVFSRSAPKKTVTMFGSRNVDKEANSKHASRGAALPGQTNFAQERAEALRRKRLNDKLSPRKNPLPNTAAKGPMKSSCAGNELKASTIFTENYVNPLANGFVKSSAILLDTPEKMAGDVMNLAGKDSRNASRSSKTTSTVSSVEALNRLKKLRQRKKEKRETSSSIPSFSSPKVQPAFHKRSYGWPSDSDSSSSEDLDFPKFSPQSRKHKSSDTNTETLSKKLKVSTPISPTLESSPSATWTVIDKISNDKSKHTLHKPPSISPRSNAHIHRPKTKPEQSNSLLSMSRNIFKTASDQTSPVDTLPKAHKSKLRDAKEKLKKKPKRREPSPVVSPVSATFVTPSSTRTENAYTTPVLSTLIISPAKTTPASGRRMEASGDTSMTPQTKQLLENITQMQKDEEIAKSLQEELDREFALSLQQSPDHGGGACEHGHHAIGQSDTGHGYHRESRYSPTFFNPPEGYECPMHARGGARGRRNARASREARQLDAELMELIQDTYSSIQTGFDSHINMPGRQTRGRRRNGRQVVMFSSPDGHGNDYEDLMALADSLGDAKQKGLSKSDINLLPIVTYKKPSAAGSENSEECNICMMEYETGDSQKILPCFHLFHTRCIDKWIQQNSTCPVCRVDVKIS